MAAITTTLQLTHAITTVITTYTDTGSVGDFRINENGDYFLLENGDYKILG